MVPGVILAAGRSSRMGQPKALLEWEGRTFVERLIDTLQVGGAAEALVVGRPEDEDLRRTVERGPFVRFVPNPEADQGQLSSLLAGLAVADRPGVHGLLVVPVDTPLIAPATVAALLHAFDGGHAAIVRAVHHGRHGHPVIFGRAVFDELRHADPNEGARGIVRKDPSRVFDLDVNDPWTLADVDTPEDYRRLLGGDTGSG